MALVANGMWLNIKPIQVVVLVVAALAPSSAMASDANPVAGNTSPIRAAMVDTAWIAGASALDLGATRYALGHCPRCYEANPLMQTGTRMVIVKAATTAGAGWICYKLRKDGHPRAAKVFRWVTVAAWSGLAVNATLRAR